jgi:uncharacterized protein YkwD
MRYPALPLLALLCTIASCLCAPAVAGAASTVAPPSAEERAVLAQINRARAARALPALRFEGRLQRTARWMSQDMVANDRFDHTDSLGRDPFQRLDRFGYRARGARGENIAAGNETAQDTYLQWFESAPHRQNMLSTKYRYVGIARVCDELSEYGCYWTTEFGNYWTLGFAAG